MEDNTPHTLLRLAAMLVVFLAVVMAAVATPTTHAQQVDDSLPPLADLTIVSEYQTGATFVIWDVTVKNNPVGAHPGVHVALVEVQITISDPVRGDTTSLWTTGNLPPGGSETKGFASLRNVPGVADGPAKVPQRFYAEIIESVPVESPRFEFNNATEHWAIENRRPVFGNTDGTTYFTNGDIALDVAIISNRTPRPGGAATFTVAAHNDISDSDIPGANNDEQDHNVFDVQVEISLSPGLSFAANQQAPSGTTFDTATGIWNVGTLGIDRSFPVAVNLTSESLADLPLEERCLTAKVVRAGPWFNDPLKRANDTDTACLGKALLASGETALFHYVDCVGVTSAPCTDADTLELVVRAGEDGYVQPEEITVQIQDPQGRGWNDGKWRTGKTTYHVAGVPDATGVEAIFSFVPSGWSAYNFMISDVSPKQRPGAFTIFGGGNASFKVLDADTKTSHPDTNLSSSLTSNPYAALPTFSALGTYKIKLTVGATKSGTAYTDSGTYTFHVGPVADLKVEAAWARPGVFTVTARNNGPDTAPAARVNVSLPTGMRFLRAEASDGSYDPGSGVWDIGRLFHAYHATLTVHTEPTGEAVTRPVTASIVNHQDYCVRIKTGINEDSRSDLECIGKLPSGYTEHSTNYYDHIPGNNKVSLAGRSTAPAGDAITRVTGMSITSSPDPSKGYYLPGQELEVEATFSDPVTAAAGARLRLQVGRSLREATVVPSTGEAIRFRYRVQWGDSTDPGKPIRVLTDPFAGTGFIKATGGRTLSLYFPGQDLGSAHTIGPQPDRVPDTNVPMWSEPVFLTTGQEGARYRFIDGMRHYYIFDPVTRRWELEFRIADTTLSADDLDLVQWLTLRASGYYGTHRPHPYGDDAHPVPGKPYLGRWDGGWHHAAQTCWGLEAAFSATKSREQRLNELGRVLMQRLSWGRIDWELTGGKRVSSMLDYAHSIAPWETCPDVPEGVQASPPPEGAAIMGIEMHSAGPYAAGNAIAVVVIFDREVEVSGAPQLAIEVGGESRTAVYDADLSGPRAKVFRYTVREADRDSDGVSVYSGSIALPPGASIQDAQGVDALLDHDGLPVQQGHTVGPSGMMGQMGEPGVAAPPAIITGLAMRTSGPYGEGDAVSVVATFDWDVTVAGVPEMNIEVGGSSRAALYQPSLSDAAVKVFSYTVLNEDSDTDGVSVYPGSIVLPAGAFIRDAQGADADLTIAGLPPQPGHTVDGSQEGQSAQQQAASNSEPQFAAESTTLSVDEDAAIGANVGDAITATDDDGDTLTYALTGSNAFAIGASSGQITVQAALDYETQSSYSLTVTVTDGTDASGEADATVDDTIAVTVNVGNVDEPGTVSSQQQQASTVPADSPLVPVGIGAGDSFRLLFVTLSTTTATSTDIADYNAFVQAAANGNDSLKPFSGEFRALISTAAVDARDNAETTGTGVTIHWMGGDKVADDYADLYDGDWDSAGGRTESGSAYTGLVWTGGNKTGEKSGQKYAGASEVRLGDLSDVRLVLSSPTAGAASEAYPLYAVSPVISVAAVDEPGTVTQEPEPPPAITAGPVIVSSPSGGDTYYKGEAIVVAMTFSESVTVAGEPRIRLKIGERNRWARYARSEASGTRLVFAYTIKGSDRDEDGVSIEADQLWLNGGNITDADGNAAGLEHAALATQSGHKVDGSLEEQSVQQQPATSTVAADSDQTGPTVAADSDLVPTGLGPGDSFRLLFVTSATTTATSTDIADYDGFVQVLAAANANLASFSDQFTAYASTATVDARDNTGTIGAGVSVHWLGGEKVADDYADLYDGDWDSVSGMTEGGSAYTGLVWTGGNKAGEKSGQRYAGAAEVRMGDLSDVTLALSSPTARASSEGYPLYALSPVITVAQPE